MSEAVASQFLVEAFGAAIASERSGAPLVNEVNWRVSAGEFWVIGGAHGSGKTALLTTMAGLRRPAGGQIRHFGQDLALLSEPELLRLRARMGFVFKGGGRMFHDLTIAGNVALPLRYHRDWSDVEASSKVAAMLELAGLSAMANESADTLSVERQLRVGLARALVLEPEILFMDEPLAGLDARERRWCRELLAGLTRGEPPARGPMAVVAATNDFSLWADRPHYYGVIRQGCWRVMGENAQPPEIH